MSLFTKTDPAARLTEVRAELEDLRSQRAALERSLGVALADGDASAARQAALELAEVESRARSLEASVPVLEGRIRDAEEAARKADEEQKARAKAEHLARRRAAAAQVDQALSGLNDALLGYLALPIRLDGGATITQALQERIARVAAIRALCPSLLDFVPVEGVRPWDRQEKAPLAEGINP